MSLDMALESERESRLMSVCHCLGKEPLGEELFTVIDGFRLFLSEEVLAQNHAVWFSPAGNRLAFIRFNDSMGREGPTRRSLRQRLLTKPCLARETVYLH